MGCHTWFSRPVTKEEFKFIKEYAPTEIYNLCGNSKENIEYGFYDKHLYDLLMKSYNEDVPCVYGKYWWQLGYGSNSPNLSNGEYNYAHEIKGHNGLFIDVSECIDIFRVENYPSKVIHSRRELRRWMRKNILIWKIGNLKKCRSSLRNIQME